MHCWTVVKSWWLQEIVGVKSTLIDVDQLTSVVFLHACVQLKVWKWNIIEN